LTLLLPLAAAILLAPLAQALAAQEPPVARTAMTL
jgi:hypothetical protein